VNVESAEDRSAPDREGRFAALYELSFPAIYGYVVRRVDAAEVRDLVQEVFATTWRSADRIPDPPADRLWLFGVAHGAVQRSHRSLFRRRRLTDRLASERTSAVGSYPSDDPLGARLDTAIAHLRARDRELLRLILWDDLDRIIVAELLGCSVNAVDIRYHRAMSRLRARLLTTQIDEIRAEPNPATES
jgi:RNA polymerase sigma-70 factor (ECF subfamily)